MNRIIPLLATVIVCLDSLCVYAARRTDTPCHLDLSSPHLDGALREVGRECGVQFIYFSDITAGMTATKLSGEYAIEDALHLLLDGTGLTFRYVNTRTVELKRSATIKRSATTAGGAETRRNSAQSQSTGESTLEEVVINGTAEGLVATRIETPLRDIPQTISVISAEQIRQQNNFDLSDALDDATGITVRQNDSIFQVAYSRGFQITGYALDGGALLRSAPQARFGPDVLLTPDLGEFDRVEVLRGANALFGADALPGGAINLIRKRPRHTPSVTFSSSAGSWNNYRLELDATGPLAQGDALRGRVDVSHARRDYFYERAQDERNSIFAVVDYDVTRDTRLTVGGSYLKSRSRPFEIGLPLFSDGTDPHLPRDTSYTFDWSHFDTRVSEAYLQLEHAFGGESRLKVNATWLDNEIRYAFGHIVRAINVATGAMPRPQAQYTLEPGAQEQLNLEATLTGTAQWGTRHVEWVLGGDFLRADSSSVLGQIAFGTPITNPYRFDPAAYANPITANAPLGSRQETTHILSGMFASLRAQLTQPWSLTAGLRVSNEQVTDDKVTYNRSLAIPVSLRYEYKDKATPYVGTLFTLNNTWSVYASYADIFLTNFGLVRSDQSLLPPSHGVNIEGGLKGAWRDGALNGSLALYKIVQRKVALLDPNAPPSRNCCWTSGGRNTSKGVEVELTGHLTQRTLIGGGYTFNQSKQAVAGLSAAVPLYETTPRHLLRVWLDQSLPGSWQRWSVGGTLRAQSASGSRTFRALQGSYAVLSPRVGYQFEGHWQAALSVNNVFDRRYFETLGSIHGGNWYGEPRNYLLRVDGRF